MTSPLISVVTGASSGVGFQTALNLANQGHTVYALARRENKLNELASRVSGAGKVYPVILDLEDFTTDQLEKVFSHVTHVDRLVNNSGKLLNKNFLEITEDEIDSVFNLNYKAVIKLIQYFHPKMVQAPNAHIVNIGSVGGVTGSVKFPGLSIYSSSKGALSILTECLAEDFREDNIQVNCLALGSVNTEMLRSAFPDFQSPTNPDEIGKYIANFVISGNSVINGLTQLVSVSNP